MTESDLGLSMLMNCCLYGRYEPSHCKTVSVMLISDKWNNSTEWQTVSKAALRSKRTKRLRAPESEARRSFATLRRAVSVLWRGQNPRLK